MSSSINTGRVPSFENLNNTNTKSTTYTTSTTTVAPVVEKVLLPTQVIEKPVAIHEEIRKELVQEIQPVVNVEKVHTEIHQVTQPLFDKETRAVQIEQRTLNTEVLSEVHTSGRGVRAVDDFSTTIVKDTERVVVEKPAIVNEVSKLQVIEEIQPVIYKETIVPTVIQETKPMYQKVVEGAVYTQETLASKAIRSEAEMAREAELNAYRPSTAVVAPVKEQVMLPTQVIEKPIAVHEEIRKELIEEIQPVVNVEKIHTEVHQITAPLFDKEVKAVNIEKRVLNTEVLPEVLVEGRGARHIDDISTVKVLDTEKVVVEKPAIINEVDKLQIIEEIQPVLYKETVVPTVIQETKPMYQKVVEGAVFTQEVRASKAIRSEEEMAREAQMNSYRPSSEVIAPTHAAVSLPVQRIEKEVAIHEEIRKEMVEEIQPVVQVEKFATEIHQVTQPLFDKEVKPVIIEQRTLNTEVLPQVLVEGRGVRAVAEQSSTRVIDGAAVIVEKPAQYIEIEKTQIIEEIQPVIYKETIIPTVIQETKPVYQRIVEGAVYTHETLAPQSVAEWRAHHSNFTMGSTVASATPMMSSTTVVTPVQVTPVMVTPVLPSAQPMMTQQTTTTTTTTSSMPSQF